MNLNLLPGRISQAIKLETLALFTPDCGLVYAVRKWLAVILNKRKIKILGTDFYYEDRLFPFFTCAYIAEITKILNICECNQVESPRVLDVGANIGVWARAFLHHCPNAVIYSFEPNPQPYSYLKKNSENFGGWKIFNFGLSGESKIIDLYYVPGKSGQGSFFKENANLNLLSSCEVTYVPVCIQSLTKEFLTQQGGGNYFDIVKIDVEGAERNVVEGLKDIQWGCMYVELSINRAGANTVESFMKLLHNYWPNARIIEYDHGKICGDIYVANN